MASAFAHAALGVTLGKLLLPQRRHWPYWVAAGICAALPDIDSIGYRLGVPYDSLWGHRGLTHSLLAAAVVAAVGTLFAQLVRAQQRPSVGRLALLLFLATASHGLLDALTTGGLGVAFFSPWHLERYFFPLRPIKVSPLSIRGFFGTKGLRVLASETIWVGLPCLLLLLGQRWWRGVAPSAAEN
ncbi:metal-dependent hydrolase [Hymenobacter sp. DH14]|uniref:Metal-dependent hydrolase n=1 Tax=Hymenobacter cyanobacteriorum TaxID=2926463 RepID=A0A9X1VFA5_9BACT|nr:metal-dependent hydrolase [Hymenobacter cyanobacteriorum]MCI1185876.1 metal-dependent hydrolase [Hymenobacter cyanobacteriorum]